MHYDNYCSSIISHFMTYPKQDQSTRITGKNIKSNQSLFIKHLKKHNVYQSAVQLQTD